MEYFLQNKLNEDKKFKKYLDENSGYIKYLNRNPESYKEFIKEMKVLYKDRATDKLSDAINTIDIVSTLLDTLQ